jgi:hypothetical protein
MNTDLLTRKIQNAPVVEIKHATAVEAFCPFTPLPKGSRGHVLLLVLSDAELARLREPPEQVEDDPNDPAPFALA